MEGTQTVRRRHYLRGVADGSAAVVEANRRDGWEWLAPEVTHTERGVSLDYLREMTWPVDPSTVERGRLLALGGLLDWQLPGLVHDVRLCVSELLSNAIEHAAWPQEFGVCASCTVTVRLRYYPARWVVVEVDDGDPRPPVWPDPERYPDPTESRGRGLWLVQQFADGYDTLPRWSGVVPGKSVRCWWDLEARGLTSTYPMFSGHPATRTARASPQTAGAAVGP